jgi:hypothetical protein
MRNGPNRGSNRASRPIGGLMSVTKCATVVKNVLIAMGKFCGAEEWCYLFHAGAMAAVVGIMLLSLGATAYFATRALNISMTVTGAVLMAAAFIILVVHICKIFRLFSDN